MLIYWSMFLIIASGAILNGYSEHPRRLFAILVIAPTILLVGLRWHIGPDWRSYASIYRYAGLLSLPHILSHQDPAFAALAAGLHRIGAPFWALNFVCGTIFIGGLSAFCRRQPNPWLAFLVAFPYLVIVIGMSGLRQSVALGILCFALNALERGQITRFAALLLGGALFHGSLIVLLPVCLISHTRNWIQTGLLLISAILMGVYVVPDAFQTYAERYSSQNVQSSGVIYRVAMNGLAAILFLAFRSRLNISEDQRRLWRNISLCTILLAMLLLIIPSSTAIDRMILYLFPLQFFLFGRLPNLLAADSSHAGQLTILVIAYAAVVQLVFLQFGTFSMYYVPYHSILESGDCMLSQDVVDYRREFRC
jgi:hypothetical protein